MEQEINKKADELRKFVEGLELPLDKKVQLLNTIMFQNRVQRLSFQIEEYNKMEMLLPPN